MSAVYCWKQRNRGVWGERVSAAAAFTCQSHGLTAYVTLQGCWRSFSLCQRAVQGQRGGVGWRAHSESEKQWLRTHLPRNKPVGSLFTSANQKKVLHYCFSLSEIVCENFLRLQCHCCCFIKKEKSWMNFCMKGPLWDVILDSLCHYVWLMCVE